MNVENLIEYLTTLDPKIPVYISSPVQGDCENVRPAAQQDFFKDDRYPALVIF